MSSQHPTRSNQSYLYRLYTTLGISVIIIPGRSLCDGLSYLDLSSSSTCEVTHPVFNYLDPLDPVCINMARQSVKEGRCHESFARVTYLFLAEYSCVVILRCEMIPESCQLLGQNHHDQYSILPVKGWFINSTLGRKDATKFTSFPF